MKIFFLLCVLFIPMIVHIVWCIEAAARTGSAIALLIVGLIVYPVGWVHGLLTIFGAGGWV